MLSLSFLLLPLVLLLGFWPFIISSRRIHPCSTFARLGGYLVPLTVQIAHIMITATRWSYELLTCTCEG